MIRYSQNELDNGNLTAIQLVNYLRISYLQKNFHTLDILNGSKVVSFAYDPKWLQKHPNLILDPTFEQSPYSFYSADKMPSGPITKKTAQRVNPL